MPPEPEEDDPVVLMYTGGTTGLPKGVLLDQRAEMLNLYHIGMRAGPPRATGVYLHQTPMFHAASMAAVLGIPAVGGTSVFVPHVRTRRRSSTLIEQLRGQLDGDGADHDRDAPRPPRLPARAPRVARRCSSTAPRRCPRRCSSALLSTFPASSLSQGYGMTECSSVLTLPRPTRTTAGAATVLRSAGRPVPGVQHLASRTRTARILPAGRGRRGVRPGRQLHARVLEPARGDRRGLPRRLVPHRRRRPPRRGGLPLPRRPGEGHDRDRRRERLLDRGRERPRRPTRPSPRWPSSASPTSSGARRCTPSSCSTPASSVTAEELRRTPASASPATRCPSRSSSAPSRCRCRAPSSRSSGSCGRPTGRRTEPDPDDV